MSHKAIEARIRAAKEKAEARRRRYVEHGDSRTLKPKDHGPRKRKYLSREGWKEK